MNTEDKNEKKGMLLFMMMLASEKECTIGKLEKDWLRTQFDEFLLTIEELEKTKQELSKVKKELASVN